MNGLRRVARSDLGARLLAAVLLLACLQLPGCTTVAAAPAAVRVLAAGLKPPVRALPAIVDRAAGIELHSCADLRAVLRAGKDLGEAAETPQFNAYADCTAAALVAEGRGTDDGAFDLRQAGDRIYRDLDLGTVASSLAQRRPAEHYRLRDLPLVAVDIKPLSVTFRTEGFAYEFRVLAIGDFSHAGHAQLLVRFVDKAIGPGTYDRNTLLVLDVAPQPPTLVAADGMAVLRAHAP